MSDELDIGTKVELKPGFDTVYDKAVAGSIGTITEHKVDDGFPMVRIEWDKEHWRYNGEEDGWTYESHFQPAQKTNLFKALEDPKTLADQITKRIKEEKELSDEQDIDARIEAYLDQLDEAVNVLSEAEGFVILTARKEEHPAKPGEDVIIPYVFGGFLDEEIMLLLEAQIVQMGGAAQLEMSQMLLNRLRRKGKEDE